jgi:ABC-2 type transport system permease protein
LRSKQKIKKELLDGLLYIPAAVIDSAKVKYYARNVSNFNLNRQLRNTVNDIVSDNKIAKSGLDPNLIKQLTRRIELVKLKVKEGEEDKESGFLEEYFVTLAFVMILYVTILIYGAGIMRGVLEEKSSRVIEVLLSSANSFQLMVGKIIGLGSVGLSQYIIWSVFGLLLTLYGGTMAGISMDQISFDPIIFLYFILFFLLGYFLYATIYAGFGAISNTDQEAQQASFPVVMLLIIPLIMMTFIVKNPQSDISIIMSIIPFFSPILMFTRINTGTPAPLEIWGSILLLLLTTIVSIWIVAKIYRIGILSYGKKPTFAELYRWVKIK